MLNRRSDLAVCAGPPRKVTRTRTTDPTTSDREECIMSVQLTEIEYALSYLDAMEGEPLVLLTQA